MRVVPLLIALSLAAAGPGSLAAERREAFDPFEASITELQLALDSGTITSEALVGWYLQRVERFDRGPAGLNSMAFMAPDVLDAARALDAERAEHGARGPLHGIPLVVKDNYATPGMPTTVGSAVLEGYMPAEEATLVRRLREAGALILGKTNMHEFADGITTEGSAFGFTRNPYDLERHPGGSSGGTAAAVAANLAVAGLGSDTCGSIRGPAAHTALVGLRGTQGASSRYGIVPLSTTQDIGGPLARSVTDLALLLEVTHGHDPLDPQSALGVGHLPARLVPALQPDALRGMRFGVVRNFRSRRTEDAEVARVFDAAAEQLEALGATVTTIEIPALDELVFERLGGFYVLSHDFARDLDAWLAAHPDAPVSSFAEIVATGVPHPTVLPLMQESLAMQSDDPAVYLDEIAKRAALREALYAVMADADLDGLIYPTIRRVASRLGEAQPGSNCHLSALSGLPALSVPAGFTPTGMPVGLEFLGRAWSDATLLGWGYAFEQATGHRRPPPLGD